MGFFDEWSDDVDDLLADMGEDATWQHEGASTAIRAVVLRQQAGREELPRNVRRAGSGGAMRNEKTSDSHGDQERAVVYVRLADLPAGAGPFDRIETPVTPGSASTRLWVVGERRRDFGNGIAAFELTWMGPRTKRDNELETR